MRHELPIRRALVGALPDSSVEQRSVTRSLKAASAKLRSFLTVFSRKTCFLQVKSRLNSIVVLKAERFRKVVLESKLDTKIVYPESGPKVLASSPLKLTANRDVLE